MGKFTQAGARANVYHPIATTDTQIPTHEGGIGYKRDAKSELFLLAVTNMVSEDTFYEEGKKRDQRYVDLIHEITHTDPEWIAKLIPWLRDTAQMRSASIVMACEYVKAGGPNGRQVVSAACKRGDEPAEVLGYWHQTYGRAIPKPVKRGVADAVVRLYNERNALRYDGQGKTWRMGDVIDLVHPRPSAPWQSALFKYLLDKRHNRDWNAEQLPMIEADQALLNLIPADRRRALHSDLFKNAGWSWERLSGWLPGGMDREAWETVIPSMGYMALLRNLRNFDQADVSDEVAEAVCRKLADPEEVAKSRQFPIRFLSAYREAGSLRWAYALEKALELSLANVPALPGRTLVLIDWSGSMWSGMSGRSKRQRWEVASIFGAAVARRAEYADVFVYGSTAYKYENYRTTPLLRFVEEAKGLGGTDTFGTLASTYQGHDRVIIITDEQAHFSSYDTSKIPLIYTWNVAGYAPSHGKSGEQGRYTFGGLTDASFQAIPLLEAQKNGLWPHMV